MAPVTFIYRIAFNLFLLVASANQSLSRTDPGCRQTQALNSIGIPSKLAEIEQKSDKKTELCVLITPP